MAAIWLSSYCFPILPWEISYSARVGCLCLRFRLGDNEIGPVVFGGLTGGPASLLTVLLWAQRL
jgi:hypothetical protein